MFSEGFIWKCDVCGDQECTVREKPHSLADVPRGWFRVFVTGCPNGSGFDACSSACLMKLSVRLLNDQAAEDLNG